MGIMWNLWHGCHKLSPGCKFCYMYRGDQKREINSSVVKKTKSFDLPIQKKRNGEYKVAGGQLVYTCFTSDFLIADADEWRKEAWAIIKERKYLKFLFITKRIDRFIVNLPKDWGEGYDNVIVCCTCENQDRADYRLPIFKSLPIKHKCIICEPLLEKIDLSKYLDDSIEEVIAGGESGIGVRKCDYDWILQLREQCEKANVTFRFKQTGAYFEKDGKLYNIPRAMQHKQARMAGLNFNGRTVSYLDQRKSISKKDKNNVQFKFLDMADN